MATTWYLRTTFEAASALYGPFNVYYSADSFDATIPDAAYGNYLMLETPGSGQTTSAFTDSQSASPTYYKWRHFESAPLAAQTLIGSGTGYKVALGILESNAAMNLYHRTFVYVWRAGSGNVKTISPGVGGIGTSCPNEHGTSLKECVIAFNGTAGDFSILDGDRIVVEILGDTRNTKGSSYTGTIYFEGTDNTMTDDSTPTASQCGGYFYSPQTLNLYVAPSSSIKTINSLAIASVKTVNGLAIASVKTWNGLAFWGVDLLRRWLKEKRYENIFNLAHSSIRYPMFRRRAA